LPLDSGLHRNDAYCYFQACPEYDNFLLPAQLHEYQPGGKGEGGKNAPFAKVLL